MFRKFIDVDELSSRFAYNSRFLESDGNEKWREHTIEEHRRATGM